MPGIFCVMNPDTEAVVFKTTRSGRRRALWAAGAGAVFTAMWGAAIGRGRGFIALLFVEAVVLVVVFATNINAVDSPVVRIERDGVSLYDPQRKTWRMIFWRSISGVTPLVIQGRHSRSEHLVFRTKSLEWKYRLPPGLAPAEEIAAAIRARLTPDAPSPEASPEAGDFFEIIFGIRLPGTAKVVHAEYHPADGSGWWSVKLVREEFLRLKAEAGSLSDWYPLTRDQRFSVGGRRLTGTADLQGDYALSTGEWESTPALVWDVSSGVLHGLLTRSVG